MKAKQIRNNVDSAEYQTTSTYYNENRGDNSLYDILVGDKMYQVQVDESGKPIMVSRYNEKYGMFVNISFSKENNESLKEEIENLLKSLYTSRILGLTQR